MKSLITLLLFVSFAQAQNKTFSEAALNEKFLSEDNTKSNFLKYFTIQRKTVFIDIWASWCKDCIAGMPKVQKLQRKSGRCFLFLSLDKETESWNHGIKKYGVIGENYFIPAGWKGAFALP